MKIAERIVDLSANSICMELSMLVVKLSERDENALSISFPNTMVLQL